MAYSPQQLVQLRESTQRLAALMSSLKQHAPPAPHNTGLSAALLSVEAEQSLRHTERILATLQPALEHTERRLVGRIQQVVDKQLDPDAERHHEQHGVTVRFQSASQEVDENDHSHDTISGRPDDQVGDATIDPADPTWIPRTVYIGDVELGSATAKGIKEVCSRVTPGQERGRGAHTARTLLSGASVRGDLIVSVSVRRKDDRPKGSWALVSFATEAGAMKLLEEQKRDIKHRLTGKAWKFLPYEPHRLQSHEAQSRRYTSAKHAAQWKTTGIVGHAINAMKDAHAETTSERTLWVTMRILLSFPLK